MGNGNSTYSVILLTALGKSIEKSPVMGILGLKTEYARLGVQSGYQRIEEEEIKGGEKVGKQLGLFCVRFSPLSPWWVCPLDKP